MPYAADDRFIVLLLLSFYIIVFSLEVPGQVSHGLELSQVVIFTKVLFIKPLLLIEACHNVYCDKTYVMLLSDRHAPEATVYLSTTSPMLLLQMELLSPVPGCGWSCCVGDVGSILFVLFSI